MAPKSDAYDHLAAGFDLEQFVPVDVPQLQVLELLAIARGGKNKTHRMRDLAEVARESAAHWQRSLADQEKAPKRAAEERNAAEKEAKKQAAELERMRAKLERDAARPAPRSQSRSRSGGVSGGLDSLLRSAGTQLGREITRTIFGTRKR